jgi:predicted TIM-barrel fold metal-dependent hydrolase
VPCWFGGGNYVHHVGVTFPSDVMYCFTHALMEGLFERHPQLKMVLLEAGGGWVYSFLERLDHKMKMFAWTTCLKRLPSEYFHDNVWVSIDPDEATTEAMTGLLGADKFMWASDYPHADGQMGVVDELIEMTPHMTESERNKILGENAIRLYKLP